MFRLRASDAPGARPRTWFWENMKIPLPMQLFSINLSSVASEFYSRKKLIKATTLVLINATQPQPLIILELIHATQPQPLTPLVLIHCYTTTTPHSHGAAACFKPQPLTPLELLHATQQQPHTPLVLLHAT